jgi:chemotaxis protein methyltransferase CheR
LTAGARAEVEQFRDKIEAELGLTFGDDRREQVAQALTFRSDALHMTPQRYLSTLDGDRGEWRHLAALLTVPESYFFRHTDHLRALAEVAIPERMAAHPRDRTLRILSAGCAGGEEPYTLSMTVLQQENRLRGWDVKIRACDLNMEMLRHAELGIYSPWALRATSADLKARYFEPAGKRYRIRDEVRRRVQFEHCNVLHMFRPDLRETCDIIFFRNVLIYFSADAIRAAVSGMAHLLAPGGYLFLGPAETLRGISDDFVLCHTHEAFYYRRRTTIAAFELWTPLAAAPPDSDGREPAIDPTMSDGELPAPLDNPMMAVWMEEIERSSERIRELHDGHNAARTMKIATHPQSPQPLNRAEEIERLASLFSAERYGDVIAGASAIAAESRGDADVLLLLALARLNRREVDAAEAACKALLGLDSLNSSGHYVLALCREQSRDPEGAAEHDRIAIYLDATFAMPHLHLALLARRQGDTRSARRAFEHASLLLARESASRILMFGGGFMREALCDLCRRELHALRSA